MQRVPGGVGCLGGRGWDDVGLNCVFYRRYSRVCGRIAQCQA